ncbi:MAG TPA: translation initiation factor [Ferruginibacter sp.]|nr:translation initiation factor [Ferruginibacter sp.]
MSKQKDTRSGIIYSTDPSFKYNDRQENAHETLQPEMQAMRVRLETKNRGGKAVTIVEGFIGSEKDKEQLAKSLKACCGTGGSYKEGEILIQGDNRDKITSWLNKNGYKLARKM